MDKQKQQQEQILNGSIIQVLTKLSLPIIGISMFSILYNLVDMFFIGLISDDAVNGVAASSFYIGLGFALLNLSRIGTQTLIAQRVGENRFTEARSYYAAGIQIAVLIGIILMVVFGIFERQLIYLIGVRSEAVFQTSHDYFVMLLVGFPFLYATQVMSAALNGEGDTLTPFFVNLAGIIINIALNPLFIFGLHFGVFGSALATVISQIIAFSILFYYMQKKKELFYRTNVFRKRSTYRYKEIIKIGLPNTVNRVLFTGFSIILANILTQFGENALGVQRIGIQLESFTWMTSFGVASALATFTGQNYGAKQYDRVRQGYRQGITIMSVFGLFISFMFVVFPGEVFGLFVRKDSGLLDMGIVYMRILGFSQFFMTIEIMTNGVFDGMGKTFPPALISIIFTGARIPMALALIPFMGLSGVWWSISATSIIKGVISVIVLLILLRKLSKNPDNQSKIEGVSV